MSTSTTQVILALAAALAAGFGDEVLGQSVEYGLVADDRTIIAVAVPDFTAPDTHVLGPETVFTILLPEGTETVPDLNGVGQSLGGSSLLGNWQSDQITAAQVAMFGNVQNVTINGVRQDIYNVLLQNIVQTDLISGNPIQLFEILLPNGCAAGRASILINGGAEAMEIFNTFDTDINNVFAIDTSGNDLYATNIPGLNSVDCSGVMFKDGFE